MQIGLLYFLMVISGAAIADPVSVDSYIEASGARATTHISIERRGNALALTFARGAHPVDEWVIVRDSRTGTSIQRITEQKPVIVASAADERVVAVAWRGRAGNYTEISGADEESTE